MAEKNFRKKLYPDYKKRKPKKPKIHPDDVAPEVGHQQEVDRQQAVQDADMREGKYIDSGEGTDSAGNPLMIKGNLMGGEGSKINPDRQAKTQRQLEREKKLRQRAGSGQQGSDIAKKKLRPEERTDLPTFLQNRNALTITKKAAQATGAFATGASMLLIKSILNNPMGAY